MKCQPFRLFTLLFLFPLISHTAPYSRYEQLAQQCLNLSTQFASATKLQNRSYCLSTLKHSDFMLLHTSCTLKNHDKSASLESMIAVISDFDHDRLVFCQNYQKIRQLYRKAVNIAYEIKTL